MSTGWCNRPDRLCRPLAAPFRSPSSCKHHGEETTVTDVSTRLLLPRKTAVDALRPPAWSWFRIIVEPSLAPPSPFGHFFEDHFSRKSTRGCPAGSAQAVEI